MPFSKFSKYLKIHSLKVKIIFFFLHKNFHFLFVYMSNANSIQKNHETSQSVVGRYIRRRCQLTKRKNQKQSNIQFSGVFCHSLKMNFAANFSSFFDKNKTFRPSKKFQPGTLKYSLHKQAQASLNSGINLRTVS